MERGVGSTRRRTQPRTRTRTQPRAGGRVVLAALTVLGFAVGACSEVPGPEEIAGRLEEVIEEVEGTPAGETPPDASTGGGEGTAGDDGAGAGQDGGGGGGGDAGGPDAGQQIETNDLGPIGVNGPAMLRPELPTLVVEVDVQEGLDPDPSALDHLIGELMSVVDKPGGVIMAGGNRFSSDRRTWTTSEIRQVAKDNRSNYSSADAAVVYVLYLRGSFEQESALGVTYNASEFAVFPDRWGDLLGAVTGGGSRVERAVLVHEVGHLFGLVNLTYDSRFGREDPEHPGHSSNRGSVMHWAIESTAIGQVFSGPPPDRFDEADRGDLTFLRTGSW